MKKFFLLNLYLLVILFFSSETYSQDKYSFYLQKAKNEIEKDNLHVKRLLKRNDSWALYKLAPSLNSYLELYLATNDEDYLLKSINIVKNVIELSKPSITLKSSQYRDHYKSWVNRSHDEKGDDGREYPLYESYFWRYVTSLLQILHEKNLHVKKYRTFYSQTLNFTEINIFEKWYSRSKDNIFRENTNMSALWAHIGYNLYKVTGKIEYLNVCKEFNSKFLKIVKYKKGTVVWNSFWIDDKRNSIQDVSHANAEVAYIVEAYSRGDFFNKELISALINTFKFNIIKKDYSTAKYLDGKGDGKIRVSDGFLKLGRFDKSLQRELYKLNPIQESEYYRFIQFYSVMVYNEIYEN